MAWIINGYGNPDGFIADHVTDIPNLPKDASIVSGTTVFVIENSSVHMLGVEGANPEDRVWTEI